MIHMRVFMAVKTTKIVSSISGWILEVYILEPAFDLADG